jgi:hypothetical protein
MEINILENNPKKVQNKLSLDAEELKTILECLLFSSSVDVCASWYKEDTEKMFELIQKIRNTFPNILAENVYISNFKEEQFCDEISNEIVKIFPEIEKKQKELV